MSPQHTGRLFAVGGGLLALILAGAVALERSREPPPAPPEALDRVARKNQDAADAAAARMRAESEAAANAADARIAADDPPAADAPSATPRSQP